MKNIQNKKILILGGTSGVGLNVAEALSKNYEISIIGRNIDKVKKSNQNNLHFFKHEISNIDDTSEFLSNNFSDVKFDGIFVSIGEERFKMLSTIKNRDLENIFLPPVVSLLAILKLSTKGKLLNHGSSIVVMSSVSSVRGSEGLALYGSSRAAIESIVKHSSNELASKKIRINAIRAGAFKSEMHSRIITKMNHDQILSYENKHLLGFGRVEDVSSMVIYLLSGSSRWFNGSVLTLDGGFLAK